MDVSSPSLRDLQFFRIAEKALFHRTAEHLHVQVVVGLCKVAHGAVLVEDMDALRHISFVVDAGVADQILRFFLGEAERRRGGVHTLCHIGFRERLGPQFNAEQASVEKPLAEQGEDAVLVVAPSLRSIPLTTLYVRAST